MTKLIRVANIDDIDEGTGKIVNADDIKIALFKIAGKIYAIDNKCRHQGGPLGEGLLSENMVSCPWHGWEFDVKTGACKTIPGHDVKKYRVEIHGNDILVEI